MSAYQTPPSAPENSKASRGCFGRFALILAVIILFAVCCGGIAVFVAGASLAAGGGIRAGADGLEEKTVAAGDPLHRIALIAVNEVIAGSGSHVAGEGMVHILTRQLRAAAEDTTVKTVLLTIDSPGGGLTASDIIYNEVRRLQKAGKKVVAAVGALAASGGYYIIAPADRIFVQPTGMVGSFGVVMEHFEVVELLQKIGVKVEPLKSTESKDIGSPFRPMRETEKKFFEKILGVYHARFVDIIAAGRKLSREKVAALATGEIYTAAEAVQHGLADAEGYFDDALAYAVENTPAGKGGPEVFLYETPLDFRSLLNALSAQSGFGQLLNSLARPQVQAQ